MFTRDRLETDPNGSGSIFGSDRASVYMEPFGNRSGTDPDGSKSRPAVLQDRPGPTQQRSPVNT